MKVFNYDMYKKISLDNETISLIAKIYEKKGEQAQVQQAVCGKCKTVNLTDKKFCTKCGKQLEKESNILSALIEVSKIQSTKASNRIEGIVTTTKRINELLKRKSPPQNRNEEEIAGYRDVLNTIHNNYEYIPFNSSNILQLHRDLLKLTSVGYAGKYKDSDNSIAETDSKGNAVRLIFTPLKPHETPDAILDICQQYKVATEKQLVDPLILVPIVIHDFLCVHPFNDANGRMSRLLTLLLFYQNGFTVGKYISLERIMLETKRNYYHSLRLSGEGWHENNNNPLHFVKYILQVLLTAYREFDERVVSAVKDKASKQDQVKRAIDAHIGKISKKEIMVELPFVSEPTIKLALNSLVKDEYVKVVGKGRNSAYVKTNKGDV